MKSFTFRILPMLLCCVVLLFSCESEHPEPKKVSSIMVKPTTLTLKSGDKATLEVSWTPADVSCTPLFSIDNSSVASIDAKGVITALAEGTASITVSIESLKATCQLTVQKNSTPEPSIATNELPLLKFVLDNDPGILDHEAKLGRVKQDVEILKKSYPSFVNKDMSVIPVVTYHVEDPRGKEDIIFAFSKEASLDNCPNTIRMLAEYGFTDLERKKFMYKGTSDKDPNLSVEVVSYPLKEYGTNLMIAFKQKRSTPEPPTSTNELPLLKFMPDSDQGILAHEAKLGRVKRDVEILKKQYPSFVNKDMPVIPVVTYQVEDPRGKEDIIFAFSKEASLDNCPNTIRMLAEYGFTDLERKKFMYKGTSDKDPNLRVEIVSYPLKEYGTNLMIAFKQKAASPEGIVYALDFPSWSAFASGDMSKVESYENSLALRQVVESESDRANGNLMFATKPDKQAQSNATVVYYSTSKNEDGYSFINMILNPNVFTDECLDSKAFKEWITINGFGQDISYDPQMVQTSAYNADHSLKLVAYRGVSKLKVFYLQIFSPTKTKHLEMLKAHSEALLLKAFHRNQIRQRRV